MSGFAYIIFVIAALLAWALGAAGAYFYYRARHREAATDLEGLAQEMADREEELRRLQYQFRKTYPGDASNVQTEDPAEVQKMREELEQKKNDYNILKQDFDLEIGILKQELAQLRSEQSNVEHTKRHLARIGGEIKRREAVLLKKEEDVKERSERLDADIAAREKHLEDEFAERAKRIEEGMAERDRQLRARRLAAEEELEALERERAELRKKQVQLDNELLELPFNKFTTQQEALLIKRLRQQIKLQREELEHLQRLYHGANVELKALSDENHSKAVSRDDASHTAQPPDDHIRSAAADEGGTMDVATDPGDSFPTYSTLSSYVERRGESAADTEPSDFGSPELPTNPETHDDLTSLPGINQQLQERLHRLGITSFDQIARWSSADVRRVSEQLEIDQKIIQDQWIINAQSHLFSRKAD